MESTIIKIESYLESIAYSILLFAIHDEKYKKHLLKTLYENEILRFYEYTSMEIDYSKSTLLFPRNYSFAKQKLSWLINEMNFIDSDEKDNILVILNAAKEKKQILPKDAAWGIVFNETLGPTLGDVDSINKIEYSQIIILNSGCNKIEKHDLVRFVNKVSIQVIQKCLVRADYNFNRLEPEVVFWISNSGMIELYYTQDDSQFETIYKRIEDAKIKCAILNVDEMSSIIALQPSVKGSYLQFINELI